MGLGHGHGRRGKRYGHDCGRGRRDGNHAAWGSVGFGGLQDAHAGLWVFGFASEALGNSPSYSWQAQANTLNEGTVLPVLYGRFMVTPTLIARNVVAAGRNQYLNLLYALAGHRIDAVEKVLINDQ